MHALVRDERGQKMSKTRGNVIDPLQLIDTYGADATRFTMAAMAAQGRDMRLAISRVEGYRNFVTKLWNAARFLEMNECRRVAGYDVRANKLALNRWIVGACARAAAAVTRGIEEYKFNEAANAAYDFVWGTFCDWYVELAKPILTGEDEEAKAETQATAAFALDQILKILHPFMPFVTEELWAETGKVGPRREKLLIVSEWPVLAGLEDAEADAEVTWLIDLVSGIRSVRTEMNVPAGAKIPLAIVGAGAETGTRVESQLAALTRLARLDSVDYVSDVPEGLGPAGARRGDLRAAAGRRHRPRRRTGAAGEGHRQAGRRDRQDRPQAGQRAVRGQGTRGSDRGAALPARRGR